MLAGSVSVEGWSRNWNKGTLEDPWGQVKNRRRVPAMELPEVSQQELQTGVTTWFWCNAGASLNNQGSTQRSRYQPKKMGFITYSCVKDKFVFVGWCKHINDWYAGTY